MTGISKLFVCHCWPGAPWVQQCNAVSQKQMNEQTAGPSDERGFFCPCSPRSSLTSQPTRLSGRGRRGFGVAFALVAVEILGHFVHDVLAGGFIQRDLAVERAFSTGQTLSYVEPGA